MGHFRKNPKRELKTDGTWVTEADWAVEAQIRLRIARTFPEHNILGEEEGLTRSGGGEPIEGAPTWIIDPIDETENYMVGIQVWATLIGLRVGDEVVVGVVHAPALGETYYAAQGSGAFLNDEPIRVAPLDRLEDATVLHGGVDWFRRTGMGSVIETLASRARRMNGFGGFWGHMLVARGSAHVSVEPENKVWDYSGVEVVVREAGGTITQFDGSPLADGRSVLTTNGALHDELVKLVT